MLTACFQMLPEPLRSRFRGDITADGTVIPVFGKKGHHRSKRRVTPDAKSPEVNAGWYPKVADRRDDIAGEGVDPSKSTKSVTEYVFGYAAHILMAANRPEEPSVPPLVLGVAVDTPSWKPGLNLVAALAGITGSGLPAGTLTTDLGYSQLLPENYALPARALGYDLMHMFDEDELGKILAHSNGLIVVEGRVYGPCLPDLLRTAIKDYRQGKIDAETRDRRIEARRAYEARLKSVGGRLSWVFRCPGCGSGRTVRCSLKPASLHQEKREQALGRTLPLVVNEPAVPPPCCTNAESVSVPIEAFARFATEYPYQSVEFLAHYRAARNQMEGRNNHVKDALAASMAEPGERRFRGWGKQLLALVMKLVAVNFQSLITWIDAEERGEHLPPASPRGRPRKPGLETRLPDPDGTPIRIIGRPPGWKTA